MLVFDDEDSEVACIFFNPGLHISSASDRLKSGKVQLSGLGKGGFLSFFPASGGGGGGEGAPIGRLNPNGERRREGRFGGGRKMMRGKSVALQQERSTLEQNDDGRKTKPRFSCA